MSIVKAVAKEEPKTETSINSSTAFVLPDIDRGLYEMLEVYGRDIQDPDIEEKVKYIQDTLGEHPKDELMHIITELGITPMGETKLNRIWKYQRLKQQADKILKHYETVKANMNSMRINQWA